MYNGCHTIFKYFIVFKLFKMTNNIVSELVSLVGSIKELCGF